MVLGSKTLREKIDIDVMKQLRGTAAASGDGASSTEPAPAEMPPMPPEVIGAFCVAVTRRQCNKWLTSRWRLLGKPMGSRTVAE